MARKLEVYGEAETGARIRLRLVQNGDKCVTLIAADEQGNERFCAQILEFRLGSDGFLKASVQGSCRGDVVGPTERLQVS